MKKQILTLIIIITSAMAFAQPANHLTFNGENQCLRIPHHQDFNIETTESYTITCWVNVADYSNFPRYVAKRDISASSGNPEIQDVTLTQDSRMTGRGCQQDIVLKAAVTFGGTNQSVNLNSMTINLDGTTDISDIEEVKVYSTGLTTSFDWRTAENATLIGTCTPANGDIVCNLSGELYSGTNYLWVTVHVADNATEGNFIDASLKSITTTDETYNVDSPSPSGNKEIILARTTVYMGGDYNSSNYRIPGIIKAKDGSLVIVTDKRKYSGDDLPADIDILSNRSIDGGRTWSEPVTIAQGTGYNHGYGDCALVLGDGPGEIIAGFVGGVGLWNSTASNPLRHYIARSLDNGVTWSTPVDITDQIYGANCSQSPNNTWQASFFGSGNGLRTSSGRIIFVAAIRHSLNNNTLYNHAVYSDDNGVTWHVSGQASTGGDEAKSVELNDGRILMSIRHSGKRLYNISNDGGETWQPSTSKWNDITDPACNGDIIRYTSVNQGYNKDRILHSIPFASSRKNVSVLVSYDEGETWPMKRTIVPYNSAYSSLCILNDGTIGLYTEEQYEGEPYYTMVFYNFSLSWLTNGEDVFEPITSTSEINDSKYTNSIYPTIATHDVTIVTEGKEIIRVIDSKGYVVKAISVNGKETITISVSGLPAGLYIVEGIGKFIVR